MITEADLAEIQERAQACDAYYPADPDLWPTALRYAIADREELIAAIRGLQRENESFLKQMGAANAEINELESKQSVSVPSEPLVSREEAAQVADRLLASATMHHYTYEGDVGKAIRSLPAVSVPVKKDTA